MPAGFSATTETTPVPFCVHEAVAAPLKPASLSIVSPTKTTPLSMSPASGGLGSHPLGERCCNPCGGTCVSATSEVACPYDSNPAIVCAGASP